MDAVSQISGAVGKNMAAASSLIPPYDFSLVFIELGSVGLAFGNGGWRL
jgi:hypothetical protein